MNIMDMFISGSKGGKAGGGGGGGAVEAPNTLQSKATLHAVELISEGEIVGLVDGAKSIYLDDTPLQNSDGSFNFTGITYVERKGTPDQAYIPGFANVQAEVDVSTQVKQAIPIVRAITDTDIDAVMVTIRIPSLTEQSTTTGDLKGSQAQIKIEYQPNGGSYITAVSAAQGTIKGKTTSPYEVQYRVQLTGSAPWNIKVTRVTADSATANVQNDTYWSSYTKVIEHKLMYPNMALIGLSVDSALFGSSVPSRSYIVKGLKINIPSNYNPVTRAYTSVWDGTFQIAWTNNPAWVLYDLITNNRYGLGDYIDADEVDKFALYSIAQYCDELVDDGAGGLEPRFTFNGVIDSQQDALKVLQVVASVFRGMLYWGAEGSSGVVTAVQDSPADAAKMFSSANIDNDAGFNYSDMPETSTHAAVFVTWFDPGNSYKPAIEVVESTNLANIDNYRKVDVVAYGCTSRGQAHRLGKWMLDVELNENESVSFKVGLADADVRPGHVIKIYDPDYADVRYGGRIISGDTSTIVIDEPVVLDMGVTYDITVVLPNGVMDTQIITNSPGTTDTLTLASPLAFAPDVMAMWGITASYVAPRQFRVLNVKENSPTEFEVTALYYDPGIYDRVESDINSPVVSFSKLPTGVIAPPTTLTYLDYFVTSGPFTRAAINVSWKASPDSRVTRYELEAISPSTANNFELVESTNGLSTVINAVIDGDYTFRVRAFDQLGNPSAYLTSGVTTISINSTPPANVDGLNINNLQNSSVLSWNPVTSQNLSHYEIRYSTDLVTPQWNSSIVVIDRVSADTTHAVVASRTGSFLIKAVALPTVSNPQGIYSTDATHVSVDIDFLSTFNFVQLLEEDPTFPGVFTNTKVSGAGNLELTPTLGVFAPYGTYQHQQVIDLGAVYTSRVTPTIIATGNLTTNDVDGWADVDLITDVDGVTDGQWNLECQVATTQLDPFIPTTDIITTFRDDFTDASWAKTLVTIGANLAAGVDGSMTADRVTESSDAGTPSNHSIIRTYTKAAVAQDFTTEFYFKAIAGTNNCIRIITDDGTTSNWVTTTIDLNAGTITAAAQLAGTFTNPASTLTPVGNGWYRFTQSGTTNTATSIRQRVFPCNNSTGGTIAYAGTGRQLFYIWHALNYPTRTVYNPWDDWKALDVGDINARAFKFQTLLWSYFATVTPSVEELGITVDMPDFIQAANDVVSSAVGTTNVTFPYTYRSATPAVVITPKNMATGDYYTVGTKTAAGFPIDFYNASNTRISRTFDWHAKGFGILS